MMFTVLGASGFIGSHLVRTLRGQGYDVYAPPRDDGAVFEKPLGHVFYCIGMTADYGARPYDTVEAHVGLLSRVLRDARFESLLYLSSTRLYDGCTGVCDEATNLILNPANPRHLFDLSKGLGESLCHASGKSNVRIARLASVYSDELDADNFLHGLIKSALRQKAMIVAALPNAARDYVHMDDACRLFREIAVRGKRPTYNVASGENVTNERLFAAIEKLTGTHITCGTAKSNLSFPLICIDAIEADFGIRPAPLEDHLQRMLNGANKRRAAS